MNDINIRAAKALGCSIDNVHGVYVGDSPLNAFYLTSSRQWIKINELRFTTSYDWAMLGVKLIPKDRRHQFEEALSKLVPDTYWMWDATPEQITQAWVEVLNYGANYSQ